MLNPGTLLGPYRILEKVGEGGMGEVYKAFDTRLERTVALKLLALDASGSPALREHLQREARALSQLNHPHICTLHDLADGDGEGGQAPHGYLVMEFVDGETLASVIARGALPAARALACGTQIADALDKAHRAGVVHGDLKPSNVMITRAGVKLLDFGLARRRGGGLSSDWADAVTRSLSLGTPEGIQGTLQYLAPEQLEGRTSDERSDIFACGTVLYEMLTGRRAFEGDSAATVIAAIMRPDLPPVSRVVPGLPPALDHIVARCLARDPDERWQHAGDLKHELAWLSESLAHPDVPARQAGGSRARAWQAATAALCVVAAVLGILLLVSRQPTAPGGVVRTSVMLPDGLRFPPAGTVGGGGRVAVSPDGRTLAVVVADAAGTQMLWLRPLDGQTATPLLGTEGAASPFWSPDSRSIAFVAQGQLRRIEATGGEPVVITAPALNSTGAWNTDGEILFTPGAGSPLSVVPAVGGVPRPVTTLDPTAGEEVHRNPSFLPGGRRFLYVAVGRDGSGVAQRTVFAGSLEGDPPVRVLANVAGARFSSGYLLFLRETTLLAQQFDVGRLALTGEPRPVAEQVEGGGIVAASFSVSDAGILAYQPASQGGSQLVWFDRQGRQLGTVADPADYADVELSPDGRLAAVSVLDPSTNTRDLWIVDVERGTRTRFTSDRADDVAPIWSRDGARIIFTSNRSGRFDLYEKDASGIGGDTLVFADQGEKYPTSWLSDAMQLLYWSFDADGTELHLLSLDGQPRSRVFLPSPVSPGRFSPDGRYVLYYSSESGRPEVYLVPFPSRARRWQVSTAGGSFARWRADGGEVFFIGRDNRLMATPIDVTTERVDIGRPAALFEARPVGARYPYDVAPGGERFLVNTVRGASAVTSVTLVQQWTRLLAP